MITPDPSPRPIREISVGLKRGRARVINSVVALAEVLLTQWPVTDGEAYQEALRVCLDVLENPARPAEDARAAFVAAARDAGVTVLPDDRDDFLDRYRKGLV